MRSAPCNQDAPNRCFALPARFAGSLIDAMFKLKEAAHAVRVDIIGNRRSADPNGLFENPQQRLPEAFEFDCG